ncbi:MAG: tRNA pseudouridine(38-40) synthase TruA [Paracoccaceae bacterium]
MPRYALKIEYDGAPFHGWQRQTSHTSVQQAVEEALRKLEPDFDSITAAGRTDAGVHAFGQVAHCDMVKNWEPFRLSEALNFHLKPLPIAILQVAAVDDDFHARFSALERQYLFRLVSRRAPVSLQRGLVWPVKYELDLERMQEAANILVGHHDFTTFRSTDCQALSPIKTLDALDITAVEFNGGTEFQFRVRAKSFLHNQVRSMVGSLERVGAGGWSVADMRVALQACDRSACGPVSPPDGLYLASVKYPTDPFKLHA